jgi:hypothetical protein
LNEPAFDELLRRLAEAGVEFVLIGGLAVNAWGVVRGKKEVDVVLSREPDNLKRVADVAVSAGGHVQRGEALLGTPFSIAAELASGAQVAIETDLGRLDVVQGLEGVPTFCSVEDLRAMKRAAGRTRDLADLEDLDVAGSE